MGSSIGDAVAITGSGHEILSAGLPQAIVEIEALMKTNGILQVLKPTGVLFQRASIDAPDRKR